MPVIRVAAKLMEHHIWKGTQHTVLPATTIPVDAQLEYILDVNAPGTSTSHEWAIWFDTTTLAGLRASKISVALKCIDWSFTGTAAADLIVFQGDTSKSQQLSVNAYNSFEFINSAGTTANDTYFRIRHTWTDAYYYRVTAKFNLASATDPIYFDIDCYAPAPAVSSLFPAGGFVDRTKPFKLSWTLKASELVYGNAVTQTAAKIRYRATGTTPYTEVDVAGNIREYTFPANTFSSPFEIQVLTQTNGGWSEPSAWTQYTTIDVTPAAPLPLEPSDDYRKIDEPILFKWQHVINTGTAQTKADLQYSAVDGVWNDLVTVTGATQQYNVPANTLPAGMLQWRVRTYNLDGVVGPWSATASFVGIGSPVLPIITSISNSARPIVNWQATNQQGYQLTIVQNGQTIWDSGEIYGAQKVIGIPEYLKNGSYSLSLRIINTLMFWSDWATVTFDVNVTGPVAPTMTVDGNATKNGVLISIGEYAPEVVRAYLLRNEIPIADVTGITSYIDYTVLGDASYAIRVVDASENFTDTSAATVTASVECAILAPVDEFSNFVVLNMKELEQPAISREKQILASSRHYAGRQLPVYVLSEFAEEQYAHAYYYTDIKDFQKLEDLINRRRTVLYRDRLGNKYYAVITNIAHTQEEYMYAFTLSVQRVDYVEAIPYAEVIV